MFHFYLCLFVFILKEIEVRPARILGVEMLLAAIFEAETLVDPVSRCIRGQGIEADCLHAFTLGKMYGLANHLRTDAISLMFRTDSKDMNYSHLVIGYLLCPIYRVIVLALIHCDSHCADDDAAIPIQIHTFLIDISADGRSRGMLAFLPSGIDGHLWRAFCHIIEKSDDGVEVVMCC